MEERHQHLIGKLLNRSLRKEVYTMTTAAKPRQSSRPMMDHEPPAHSLRFGNYQIATWERETDNGFKFYRTTITKSYKDSDGNWKHTNQLEGEDLEKVARLAHKMYQWVCDQQLNSNGS